MGYYLQYANYIFGVITVIVGTFLFYNLSTPYRFALLYVVVGSFFDIASFILYKLGFANINYNNYYILIDFALSIMPALILAKKIRAIYIIGIVVAINFFLYNITTGNKQIFLNWCLVLQSILIVIIYLDILINKFRNSDISFRNPEWALTTGLIIFYGCCIPFFCFINYLIKTNNSFAGQLYVIIDLLNIFKYIFIAISFALNKNEKKTWVISR